jgi:hypothetical protein
MKEIIVALMASAAALGAGAARAEDATAPQPAAPSPEVGPAVPEAPDNAELPPGEAMRQVDGAIAALAEEPALAELERAALRRGEADAEPVDRLKRTVLGAAALPTVKVTVDRDESRAENLDRYQDDPDRWGADTDRGLGVGVSAEWKLGELVFNADEVRVYDLLGDRADRREALLTLLVGYYFERRRLLLTERLAPAATADEAIERRMRIDELTAVIDALTGGLLSRTLSRNSAR